MNFLWDIVDKNYGTNWAKTMGMLWDIVTKITGYISLKYGIYSEKLWDISGKNYGIYWVKL